MRTCNVEWGTCPEKPGAPNKCGLLHTHPEDVCMCLACGETIEDPPVREESSPVGLAVVASREAGVLA